ALQDHDRALIVGEPTFGKGLVQNPFQLPYGSALLLTIAKYQTPSGRDIQRDYSKSGLYDYYTNGGTLRDDKNAKPSGTETKTDAGRTVYGGGGIAPDEIVKPLTVNELQQKMNDPIFGFALVLSAGKVNGFNSYAVNNPINFKGDIKKADFPVTNEVYAAFKKFVAGNKDYKLTQTQLDKERAYIERQLRFELATATYGSTTSFQVYNDIDPQVNRAIELLPKAEQLAQTAAKMQRTTVDNF
ncbi:MAG: hypothetical protein H7Z37_03445, partial [Pyrinomonadaceae bacterium]|nr:hypothetical protein [Pyrinomonadaceae bacterium]